MVEEKGGKIKCSHTTYNLILMDIEMPIMNGFQATANVINIYKIANKLRLVNHHKTQKFEGNLNKFLV